MHSLYEFSIEPRSTKLYINVDYNKQDEHTFLVRLKKGFKKKTVEYPTVKFCSEEAPILPFGEGGINVLDKITFFWVNWALIRCEKVID